MYIDYLKAWKAGYLHLNIIWCQNFHWNNYRVFNLKVESIVLILIVMINYCTDNTITTPEEILNEYV